MTAELPEIPDLLPTLEERRKVTVRLTQHDRTPCPGPPVHNCTDRTHPIAVDVFNVDLEGPALLLPLRAGASSVSVAILSVGDDPA